jgi:hypothetical protein
MANSVQVVLKLNRLPQLEEHHKEFDLLPPPKEKVKNRRPAQALVFSEKDLPGYKSKSFVWDVDDDENAGQGRSKLYDDAKRKARNKERKENRDFQPYRRRAIPKHTAITGVVTKEFDAVPVKNADYAEVERRKMAKLLSGQAPRGTTQMLTTEEDPTRRQNVTSMLQRQRDNRVSSQPQIMVLHVLIRARLRLRSDKPSRTTGRRAWTSRRWCSYSYLTSSNIASGAYEISKLPSSSQSNTFARFYTRLDSCISKAISMESGS